MASITAARLKSIIADAYIAGNHGCAELRDTYVQEVIDLLITSPENESELNKNEGWHVYKVKELQRMGLGTVFEHYSKGKCWIESSGVLGHHMKFESGEKYRFLEDIFPWTQPMRVIGRFNKKK